MTNEERRFRNDLDRTVQNEMNSLGMLRYMQDAILDYLQARAQENGVTKLDDITRTDVVTWNAQNEKTGGEIVTGSGIIEHSVRTIIKTAVANAFKNKRDALYLSDVEHGVNLNFL